MQESTNVYIVVCSLLEALCKNILVQCVYVCDDISVCRRRVCMCVMIFQCVGGECVCV